MKLSEMNTAQLADALVRIAAPIERIGKDEELNRAMSEGVERLRAGGMTKLQHNAAMLGMLIPALLERHRADTFTVLSALTGKSVQEIEGQPGVQTLREARECLDGDLLSFFR